MSILLLRRRPEACTLTATTTAPAQTVRIRRVRSSQPTSINWGDGTVTSVPADTNVDHTHTYAAAGAYPVVVPGARNITSLWLESARLSGFNSYQLRNSALTWFILDSHINPTVDTAHCRSWPITSYFIMNAMTTGNIRLDTADMVGFNATHIQIRVLSVGAYTINTAHFAHMDPTSFEIRTITAPATHITTVAASDFAGFRATTTVRMDDMGLITAQVNAILWGMYQAAITPRTGAGGLINVGGTNQAPSGVFQAATACPVSVATDGKEVAHELLNDTCAAGFNTWTSVTITA